MVLGFIGAGKMATAIASGLVQNGIVPAPDIRAADISAAAANAFRSATGCPCSSDAAVWLGEADVVLLAVKPQYAQSAIAGLPPVRADALVISIVAGISLASLRQWFRTDRVIRVMPNTPLTVGRGASVFATGPGTTTTDADVAQRIFGSLGTAYAVDESLIDAVTALSGSGPAYVFEMVQALVDAAVSVGIPEVMALALTVQTVAGAAEMLKRNLGTPDELRTAVTSPGGTTEAGLRVLSEADFRGLIRRVVVRARDRSVELGRGGC